MAHAVIFSLALILALFSTSESAKGYGPGEQDWGFIDVREGAHMFYWLYYTTANVSSYTQRPLVIWLQGGPGASSTGYGNFEELGPLTLEGEERSFTWVKDMNVLFIDNPVGTGFSYVDNLVLLTKTNNEIALDLVAFMKGFYTNHPEFESVPLHIFSESYGGKMSPEFALELHRAIKRGEIRSNLKSVLLGDPWTSPIDSVLAWAPLLLSTGIVDFKGYEDIMVAANKTASLVEEEKWLEATYQWSNTQGVLLEASMGVDFYNIEKKTEFGSRLNELMNLKPQERLFRTMVTYDPFVDRDQILEDLMTGPVADALKLNRTWGRQSSLTFDRLSVDFMKPAVHIVTELLDSTDVEVGVLTGQLDLICATLGTVNFVDKMNWSYKGDYEAAPREAISVNGVLEGYQKKTGKFALFWAVRAGHMVPSDNPAVMDYILQYYTKYDETTTIPSFL